MRQQGGVLCARAAVHATDGYIDTAVASGSRVHSGEMNSKIAAQLLQSIRWVHGTTALLSGGSSPPRAWGRRVSLARVGTGASINEMFKKHKHPLKLPYVAMTLPLQGKSGIPAGSLRIMAFCTLP